MKKILAIACLLFSGYVSADVFVAHPEDPNTAGYIYNINLVCFTTERFFTNCIITPVDPVGMLLVGEGFWRSNTEGAIGACGTDAVIPVSRAVCPTSIVTGKIDSCVSDGYVLVQTLNGYFFAVKANADCTAIATPETTGIVPCLSTDAFDPVNGCFAINPNPSQIGVEDGFIKLDAWNTTPPIVYCSEPAHDGRMVVDSVNSVLYVCTQNGWTATQLGIQVVP